MERDCRLIDEKAAAGLARDDMTVSIGGFEPMVPKHIPTKPTLTGRVQHIQRARIDPKGVLRKAEVEAEAVER